MRELPRRYLAFVIATLVLCLLGAGFFLFKDAILFRAFLYYLRRACPACEVRAQGLDIGWRSARADALTFRFAGAWSGRLSDVRVLYDPGKLMAGSLDGLREAWMRVERVAGPQFLIEDGEAGAVRAPAAEGLALAGRWARARLFDKEITQIAARASLRPDGLMVTSAQGRFAGGLVSLTGTATAGGGEGALDVVGLDAAQLLRALDMEKRVQANGSFSGRFAFSWGKSGLASLSGRLLNKSGGSVDVAETPVLPGVEFDRAANIVVESLKNYHYDRGEVFLGLEERNVKIDFMLEGPAGRRDITLIWHPEEAGDRDPKADVR